MSARLSLSSRPSSAHTHLDALFGGPVVKVIVEVSLRSPLLLRLLLLARLRPVDRRWTVARVTRTQPVRSGAAWFVTPTGASHEPGQSWPKLARGHAAKGALISGMYL